MKWTTHLAGATAASLAFTACHNLPLPHALGVTACAMAASLLPDIDTCTSKAGHSIAPISFSIQLFIGHRTLFHAPIIYLVSYGLLMLHFPEANQFITAGAIGIASHILLDMLNPGGIPFLWPYPKRFRLASIRSNGILDHLLGVFLSIVAVALIAESLFG